MIRTRRIYDTPNRGEGFRVLVDRLWPRGISKARAGADLWLGEISPSHALRKWFAHDPKKWAAFKKKYARELESKKGLLQQVRQLEKQHGTVTLLYSAKDEEYNQAAALRCFLRKKRRP